MIGPKSAEALRQFLAAPVQQEMPDKPRIESMIAKLATASAMRPPSKKEAEEMHELYWLALKDLPLRDLAAAFTTLLKTSKFMPKPAEIHAAAMLTFNRRNHLRNRAKYLVWKHEREWVKPLDPADIITPEEAAAITRATAAKFPSERTSSEN